MEQSTFNILYFAQMGIHAILTCFNIAISWFLIAEWRKPKSIFKSSYFVILNSYYILEIFGKVIWTYGRTIGYDINNPLISLILLSQWYIGGVQGIWEVVLGLTRCTALAFPNVHKKLWTRRNVTLFLILIYIFPFISMGDMLSQFDCKFLSSPAPGCLQYRTATVARQGIMGISLNLLCLLLILIGVILSPKGHQRNKSNKAKIERRLMLQTLFSAIMVILFYVQIFFPVFTNTNDYMVTSYLFFLLQYYPPMFVLFILVPPIRSEFMRFYFPWIKKSEVAVHSVTIFHTQQWKQ